MKRLREAVPLEAILEDIGRRRETYRVERIARFGWPEEVACPACGDSGVPPDRPLTTCLCSAGEAVAQERRRAAAWEAAIPRRMRSWSFGEALDRAAAHEVKRWLADDPLQTGQNLILFGSPGTGKTGLAVSALARLCHAGAGVAFHVVADLLDTLRTPRPDKGEAVAEKAMTACQKVRVLCLDDLGAERPTEFASERIYVLLNARMNAALPTIVTTNLEPDRLHDAFGSRIMRRLTQDGLAREVYALPE